MILIAIGILVGTPILWSVSVGAVREARRARLLDPAAGCQAWVSVPGLRGRLYRCGAPRYAGGPWCRRHEVERSRGSLHVDPDAERIEQHQAVGRAVVQARIGVPLAVVTMLAFGAFVVWLLQRA